jgi:hypothetical protein
MPGPGLTTTIQEHLEYKREEEWRREGVPEGDIEFSRLSGMDARDVRAFRAFTKETKDSLLIVVRCPKVSARAHHGVFRPKTKATEQKTGTSGLAVTETKIFVSDYDLMSVWQSGLKGFEKIFISAEGGAPRGRWTPQARRLIRELNRNLVSRIQHGCQDDYNSPRNPGVKAGDHFAAFQAGAAEHLADMFECARYYTKFGLVWPYDRTGKYVGGSRT